MGQAVPTAPLSGGCDARSTVEAVTAALVRQPGHMVKTLTWDQGIEMARWADVEDALDIEACLLQAPVPLAKTDKRADQRSAVPLAAEINRPEHRPRAPRLHQRQPQRNAPPTTPAAISPNRLR